MLAADDGSAALGGVVAVLLLIGLGWCCLGGLIGWAIAKGKGRGAAGFWLGLLLGWIGWIIAACLSPSPQAEARRIAETHGHLMAMTASMQLRQPVPTPGTYGGGPGWYPDPLGRFEHRYWDGARWTEHVSRHG